MDEMHHVTHAPAALRILEDAKISRRLISDKCSLNDSRTTVVWLSPNRWIFGSIYGNVESTYDFKALVKGRKIYWVEVHTVYNPHACRFLITNEDVGHLPVQPYDPTQEEGPLRCDEGVWYWNWTYTGEFMLQSTVWLTDCQRVDFIKHHDRICSIGGCNDLGKDGYQAAGRVIAYILSRGTNVIKLEKASLDRGLFEIRVSLGASAGKLAGPIKVDVNVDAVLRAALLQYAMGEFSAAKQTASFIGSDEIFKNRLSNLAKTTLG
jgi:hypothetical protein